MVQAIPAAIAVGGSIVKGLSTNAAYKASARADEANAVAELNDGVAREAQIRDAAREAIGRQVTAQGESGFAMGTGSALDALTQSQINATMDALQVRREAASRAAARRASADQNRRAGNNALIAAGFDAVSGALKMKNDWAGATAGKAGG